MQLNKNFKYIVIEGNIGAGKTSLAKRIAADTGSNLLLEEFAENTFLPQFYKEPQRYAFPLELSFLASRYQQLKKYFEKTSGIPVVSDYHFIKSFLFAGHNLGTEELELYRSFYDILATHIPEPDIVIFLDPGIEQLQKNIHKRGRIFEAGITEIYLEGIKKAYQNMMKKHPFSKLLMIPSGNMDFVNNENDYLFIINKLT
jgi:deoxyadenosine/deoxycytidine kinase